MKSFVAYTVMSRCMSSTLSSMEYMAFGLCFPVRKCSAPQMRPFPENFAITAISLFRVSRARAGESRRFRSR